MVFGSTKPRLIVFYDGLQAAVGLEGLLPDSSFKHTRS